MWQQGMLKYGDITVKWRRKRVLQGADGAISSPCQNAGTACEKWTK